MIKHKGKSINSFKENAKVTNLKLDYASSFINSLENLLEKSEEAVLMYYYSI